MVRSRPAVTLVDTFAPPRNVIPGKASYRWEPWPARKWTLDDLALPLAADLAAPAGRGTGWSRDGAIFKIVVRLTSILI